MQDLAFHQFFFDLPCIYLSIYFLYMYCRIFMPVNLEVNEILFKKKVLFSQIHMCNLQ